MAENLVKTGDGNLMPQAQAESIGAPLINPATPEEKAGFVRSNTQVYFPDVNTNTIKSLVESRVTKAHAGTVRVTAAPAKS